MSTFGAETFASIGVSLKGTRLRLWSSLSTVFTVALVTAVLLFFQALSNGFIQALRDGASDDVAIVLSKGASRELSSVILPYAAAQISHAPGIAQGSGEAQASVELYMIVNAAKTGGNGVASLLLRGMGPEGPRLRNGFQLVAGRMFRAGHAEIVVGRNAAAAYANMRVGDTLKLGRTVWTVVGTFTTGGSVYESELWTDADTLRQFFDRPNVAQSVRVRLASPAGAQTLRAFIAADPRLNLEVTSEGDYLRREATRTGDLILRLGWPLAIAMALGAIAGAINSTSNSVATRLREIATLRAIGFRASSALIGTLVETVTLAGIGGALGVVIALVFFDGLTASTLGSGYTQQLFSLRLSAGIMIQAVAFALLIGLVGGLIPAIRAARVPIVQALHG